MDRRQKSTLRSHHIHLANELILDEDFFAALRQNKIFTDGMLQIIKDVRKPRDQVYKMLELLEKRGPAAFENFVWILRENFSWIADMLEETYELKGGREKSAHRQLRRAVSTPQATRTKLPSQMSAPALHELHRPRGKKVVFKSEASDTESRDGDTDYLDEQDGGAVVRRELRRPSSEMNTMVKKFADKCISPIQVFESPRKSMSNTSYPQQESSTSNQEFEDNKEISVSQDKAVSSNNGEIVDAEMGENDSVFDANSESDIKADSDDDCDNGELEDGEIFYDRMRRESEMNDTENNESIYIDQDDVDGGFEQSLLADDMESQLNTSSIDFRQTEEDSEIQDIYSKLLEATDTQLEPDTDLCQVGITYKMLHELIDKLISDKQNAEESVKIVKKCLSLFPDKDKKFPLVKNIEKLMEEKGEISNRLFDEMRKTNEMAHDMYIHSQEMKNLEKLKKTLSELEKENSLLQTQKSRLERENLDKDRRINELEKSLRMSEEIRQANNTEKKTMTTRRNSQRRVAPPLQSPRKPSLGPASQMTNLRNSFTNGQASPRQGTSSAWGRHYPKR